MRMVRVMRVVRMVRVVAMKKPLLLYGAGGRPVWHRLERDGQAKKK